jgi:hypothetical protein
MKAGQEFRVTGFILLLVFLFATSGVSSAQVNAPKRVLPNPHPIKKLPATATTGPSQGAAQPYDIVSYRLEKPPDTCETTLIVDIKNNTSAPTDSGLFLHVAQYRDIGNGQQMSTMVGAMRVGITAPGQSTEGHLSFIRQRDKTFLEFRFMVGPNTVGLLQKPLPAVTETYGAVIENAVYSSGTTQLNLAVKNTGALPIPKPAVQVMAAFANAPDSFQPAGGSMVAECLAPGASAPYDHSLAGYGDISRLKVTVFADSLNLAEKIIEVKPASRESATGRTLRPTLRTLKK